MTQKTIVTLIDDINGNIADNTIRFSYAGTDYEIDLTAKNEKALRKVLAQYIEKGRRVKGNGTKITSSQKVDTKEVRQWARKNGYPDLSNYGRIPAEIMDQYHARER